MPRFKVTAYATVFAWRHIEVAAPDHRSARENAFALVMNDTHHGPDGWTVGDELTQMEGGADYDSEEITSAASVAADIGPGMTNAALADLLDAFPLAPLSDLHQAALNEASQRIRERGDDED